MAVSSYLELYLGLFGWILFDEIWDIMTTTGLAYVPFIGMLLRNAVQPMYQQDMKEASLTSLRRIELDIFCMLTVVVLATQPAVTLDFAGLSYTKACSGTAAAAAGATGTTYDTAFSTATLGGSSAQVPIWWYGVLALSAGFNDAVVASIPCTGDLRLLSYRVQNARVQDPQLRRQVQLFMNDCYRYAMARFLDTQPALPSANSDDISWLGSTTFLDNYYGQQRASEPIPGFAYNATRDVEYDPAIEIPAFGKPTCQEWWTGSGATSANAGLRQALVNQVDTSVLTDFKTTVAASTGKTPTDIEDIVLKTLVSREKSYFNGLHNLQNYNDRGLDVLNSVAGTAGTVLESLSFYPKLYLVKVAAPIVQASVLMVIYTVLPFVILFSSYQVGVMVFVSVSLFSVKFWTVLWALAHWLDNNLVTALEPESWYQLDVANNLVPEMLVNFVTGSLFIGLPLAWSALLGWAGFTIGSGFSSLTGQTFGLAQNAGASGTAAVRNMAGGSVKK